jgi:hypothetical protein
MTEPMEAVSGHRGGQHGRRHDERGGCRSGDRRRDPRRNEAALGPGDRPADDPPSPGRGPDRVTVLLRKLRDAAAAHDKDLSAAHCDHRASIGPGSEAQPPSQQPLWPA